MGSFSIESYQVQRWTNGIFETENLTPSPPFFLMRRAVPRNSEFQEKQINKFCYFLLLLIIITISIMIWNHRLQVKVVPNFLLYSG